MHKLLPASQYGPEYLTYVLWAITPEGRSKNLGEVVLDGGNSHLDVTTDLQAFALIVTAEPYFGVSQPSDVVVMENIVREDTVGKIEQTSVKYDLLKRGSYTMTGTPGKFQPGEDGQESPAAVAGGRERRRRSRRWPMRTNMPRTPTTAPIICCARPRLIRRARPARKPVIMTSREAVQNCRDGAVAGAEASGGRTNRARKTGGGGSRSSGACAGDEAARQKAMADARQRNRRVRPRNEARKAAEEKAAAEAARARNRRSA